LANENNRIKSIKRSFVLITLPSVFVKQKVKRCVSKVEMSPLIAKLKYPYGTGEDTHGTEAVTEVASDEDGRGREDHLEGGK
jgi:hypothetical protein